MDFLFLAELMSLFHRSVLAVLFICAVLMAFYLLRSELPDALRAKVARIRWHYLMPIITTTLFSRLVFFPKCSLTIIEENFLRIGWGEVRPSYGGYLPTYILGDLLGIDGLTAAISMLVFEAVNIAGMILVWWMIRQSGRFTNWRLALLRGRFGTMKRA